MTKKEIYEAALKAATDANQKNLDELKSGIEDEKKSATQKEISRFAALHDDFEKFRPVMYGLSTEPKNKDLSLQELYTKAKVYVQDLPGTSKEAKTTQRNMWSERPGGASESMVDGKRLSDKEATIEAVKEVEDELGPLPSV